MLEATNAEKYLLKTPGKGEDLEFALEIRLAQIVSYLWASLMYSTAYPILLVFNFISLTITFWIDKYLIFRFYRPSADQKEHLLHISIQAVKGAFFFHLAFSFFTHSNGLLFQSGDTTFSEGFRGFSQFDNFFHPPFSKKSNLLIFFFGNITVTALCMLDHSLISLTMEKMDCMQGYQVKFDKMKNFMDDYLRVCSFNFLVNEYKRALTLQENYENYIRKLSDMNLREKFGRFSYQMQLKQRLLEAEINNLCNSLGIEESNMLERIKKLVQSNDKVH